MGIPVIAIEPRNTSRECPVCHTTDRRNRTERSHFRCVSCEFEGEADFVASLNIRNRAAVSQPIVAGAIFGHSTLPAASSEALARSS
ncbi:MAG: zinc ribbon domain-containing protein [Thermoplasmata archaeon]